MDRYVAIGQAAKALGVSITILRRWEVEGKLCPERTAGRQHRDDLAKFKPDWFYAVPQDRKTLAYARRLQPRPKGRLERQKPVRELYCAKQSWTFEGVADFGSGMNYNKKGLKRLLDEIIAGRVGHLVIAHKDRLLRFGAEWILAICEAKDVEVRLTKGWTRPSRRTWRKRSWRSSPYSRHSSMAAARARTKNCWTA